jgi:hypothetical protein
VIVGLILAKIFRIKKVSLVLLGTILPDIVYKLKLMGAFFYIPENAFQFGLLPFHSPIGLIILTLLLSYFFRYPRVKLILVISLGWISHILLDLTNKHFLIKQTYLFLPISYKAVEFGWFWQDQYHYMLIPSLMLLFLLYAIDYFGNRGRDDNKRRFLNR